MATHADGYPDEPSRTRYPGSGYPTRSGAEYGGNGYPPRADTGVGYPSEAHEQPSVGHPPAGPAPAEQPTRHVEAIPRYPVSGPPTAPTSPSGPTGMPPGAEIPAALSGQTVPAGQRPGAPYPEEDLRLEASDLRADRMAARPYDIPSSESQTVGYPAAASGAPASQAAFGPPAAPPHADRPRGDWREPEPPRTAPAGPPPGQFAPPQPGDGPPLADLLQEHLSQTDQGDQHRTVATPTAAAPDTGVYRANGRASLAVAIAAATVLLEVPVGYLLAKSLILTVVSVSGVVSGLLLAIGLPMFAAGVYELLVGRVVARPGEGLAALARKPFALLLLGAFLLLAAGLAA